MEAPECPVCLEPFDSKVTVPRVLPCGHSACDSCLLRLPKPPFPSTIRCPACNHLLPFPSSLPKNIDLLRLISSPSTLPPPPLPKPPALDFIPIPFPHHFLSNWNQYILPQRSISLHPSPSLLNFTSNRSVKTNHQVTLFNLASFLHTDEDTSFNYSYLAKAMSILSTMGDDALAQLQSILNSSLIEFRICIAFGLWYSDEDRNLYLVCERKQTNLSKLIQFDDVDVDVDIASFAMMGMELCETVSQLHDAELVTGCASLSCFGSDEFGHVFVDLNQVLMDGRRVQKVVKEAVVSGNNNGEASAGDVMKEIPSLELLVKFVENEGVEVKLTCAVGYSSDVWWLGCVLLSVMVGKAFVEEMRDFLRGYVLELVNGNGSDCERLHASWLGKVSALLDNRLGLDYGLIKELLCKCLAHDPGMRPLIHELWKCLRALIINPKFDMTLSMERETKSGSACHCLLLGDLLWSSRKTNEVADKSGTILSNFKDESFESDVIEGVCKNSLTCTDLKGHVDCISGLAIGGGFLFSCSFDKTINVWSLQGLNHVHTFKGHEHKVMALVFVEREGEVPLCISGDNGGEIFIWGIKLPLDTKPIKRVHEEKDWRYSGIHALAAVSGSAYFYTGSGDKTVKAWSMHDYSLSCTMNGHKSVVCTLAVCNGVLYSGSWDGTVRLWCLSDHSPLAVLGEEAPCGSVLSLAAHSHTLVAAHENGLIKIWNKDVGSNPISVHTSSIFSVYIEGQWLFSGGWNKTVVVQKLSGDESQVDVTEIGSIAGDSVVTALHYWQGRLFVGHADRTIKVYNWGG